MPVGPLAVLDETSLALSVHVLEQTRADWQAEGKTYVPSAGEALVERMVKEFDRPGPRRRRRLLRLSGQARRSACGRGSATLFEKAGVDAGHRRAQAPPAVPPVDRDGALPGRGRADEHVHEANIGSIFGIGFPAWTGGAMQFVASEGKDRFLANAAALADRHGDRFAITADTLDAALARSL